ncbi:MAG: hypothetical protein U1B78_08385, partial [Dehalococcoidia bacterium]|nr:hypothetical protein [Dehalococcoidia bacterium]
EPWPPETALRELQLLAGSHLDARLVDAFIQLWEAGVIERITQEMGDASSDGQAPIERAA